MEVGEKRVFRSSTCFGVFLIILILTIASVVGIFISKKNINFSPSEESKIEITNSQSENLNLETVQVTKVVDGDTIEVSSNGKEYKVRYIGIDTPETVNPNVKVECFGKEASNKNKELLEGKTVFLEKDVGNTDRYGRLLRYIYLDINGNRVMVNKILIAEGYASAVSYPPNVKYQNEFKELEREARENSRGFWGKCKN